MKNLLCFLAFSFILIGCKKEETTVRNSFVKTYSFKKEMAALACFQSPDKQTILVGRSNDNYTKGWILKIDNQGEEVWRKLIPPNNEVLWNAIPLKTGGFITIGWKEISLFQFEVVKYDDDANVLFTQTVALPYSCNGCSPANVIELPNGNFAFATSHNGQRKGYLIVTDNEFNLISTKTYEAPEPGYLGFFINGLQQLNDSTLAINASSSKTVGGNTAFTNSILMLTDLSGEIKTLTFLKDSLQSETTNFLGTNSNGLLSVTASMAGWNNGNGLYVNYLNSGVAQLISGKINLIRYSNNGNFMARKQVLSYPGNGMINKARKTRDGGFVLCGTVNQSNSAIVDPLTKVFLLKVDANNNISWSKVFNGIYPAFGVDTYEMEDGGFFIAGYHLSNNQRFNIIAIKTDKNGEL